MTVTRSLTSIEARAVHLRRVVETNLEHARHTDNAMLSQRHIELAETAERMLVELRDRLVRDAQFFAEIGHETRFQHASRDLVLVQAVMRGDDRA